jgi:predicted nucleic-acid-binding protein
LIKREVGAQEKVLIGLLVLLETEWVLRSRHGLQKNQFMDTISGLLDAAELELEDEPTIEEALYLWKDRAADFADCLIGAHHRRLGCRATATFDARAVKLPGSCLDDPKRHAARRRCSPRSFEWVMLLDLHGRHERHRHDSIRQLDTLYTE